MKIQVALLCDALEITDKNLINVYNGGITAIRFKKLPDTQFMAFVLAIEYIQAEESGKHTIEIRIIDGNGSDKMEPKRLDADFNDIYNTYNLWYELSPRFDKFEMHNVIVMVDEVELASLQLDILPDTPSEMKGEEGNTRFRIQEDGTVILNRDNNSVSITEGRISSQYLHDNCKPKVDKSKLRYDDICILRKYISKLGLELKGFQSNDALELFFNVKRDGDNICYISKGWNDPGFRIGEYMEINKSIPDFKEKFYKIFKACSKNIIAIDISEPEKGKIGLNFQIGLYDLNEKILTEAIDVLGDSLKKIRLLLKA